MTTEKNYRTVPNQKTIMNKVKTEGRYYQVDEATFTLGCSELKPTTFLVWQALHLQYFTEQKLALSTSVISELMGNLRLATIKAAINELIEKGWMVEISPNCFELITPVVRKASDENNDVVRKAYHASYEKRTTGGTESVLEIRRREEEDKNNTSRTETVEKEEEARCARAATNKEEAAQQTITTDAALINPDAYGDEKRCFRMNYKPWKGKQLDDEGCYYEKQELTFRELCNGLYCNWSLLFDIGWIKEHPLNKDNVKIIAKWYWDNSGTWRQQKDKK